MFKEFKATDNNFRNSNGAKTILINLKNISSLELREEENDEDMDDSDETTDFTYKGNVKLRLTCGTSFWLINVDFDLLSALLKKGG